jgi:hypothetical protein
MGVPGPVRQSRSLSCLESIEVSFVWIETRSALPEAEQYERQQAFCDALKQHVDLATTILLAALRGASISNLWVTGRHLGVITKLPFLVMEMRGKLR